MKIDLFYELEMPKPWSGPNAESDLYWQSIDQIRLADEIGFDTVWVVEHHFRTEFSHSCAPEVFLSAVAQHTRNIRIGHGVVLLPYPFNHPIRVAERVATLDILSRGRVEFGYGRSGMMEQMGFGIKPEESRPMMLEAIKIIPKMWQTESFSYDGKYFKIPERNIIPKPVQKPHPPIWQASTSPDSWVIAGQQRVGALGLTVLNTPEEIHKSIESYRIASKTGTPVGAFPNDQVRVFTVTHCAETDQKAMEQGGGAAAIWYIDYILNQQLALERQAEASQTGGPRPYSQLLKRFEHLRDNAAGSWRTEVFDQQDMIVCGNPDTCIKKLEHYEQAGVDGFLCLMQAGHIKHEDIMRSIRLFGEHVIPYFKKKGLGIRG